MKPKISRLVSFKYSWEDLVTALMNYADPDDDIAQLLDGARIITFKYFEEDGSAELLLEAEN